VYFGDGVEKKMEEEEKGAFRNGSKEEEVCNGI
jgi:hypothetical protein